jgi:hypothetical protein
VDCPAGWPCASIYPAPGNSFCAPPATWISQATQVRAAGAASSRPAPVPIPPGVPPVKLDAGSPDAALVDAGGSR